MKYKLKGLDCPNCALKIEEYLNNQKDINVANVDYITKTLFIETKMDINSINKLIQNIEKDVIIVQDKDENDNNKLAITRIILTIIFIIISLFIKNNTIKFLILLVAYLVIGLKIVIKAIKNMFKGQLFDENFLMSVATIGAFFIGEYLEAVCVMLFYSIGEFLEDVAVDNSRKKIYGLLNNDDKFVTLNNDKKINVYEANIDDVYIVKPGEKVLLDGIIVCGESFINTAFLTGESLPQKYKENDLVYSGMINMDSLLEIKVTKTYENSYEAKLLEKLEYASSQKARTENFITDFSKIYTPVVVLIAVLVAVLPPIFTNVSFNDSLYKALICLVISCPCALVLSVPLSYFSGLGSAAKKGILIKGANYLDVLPGIKKIIFDKTGTLTKGTFNITKIVSNDLSEDELLKIAASLEVKSNHPIAQAISKAYTGKLYNVKKIKEIPGFGLSGYINDDEYKIGNDKKQVIDNLIEEVGSICFVTKNEKELGYIVVSDEIKDKTIDTINNLNKKNITTIMLTGDNNKNASVFAKKIGISEFNAELMPEDKLNYISSLCDNNEKIAFVGDGINDSLALARVDVGFAMGGIGSDIAIDAADIILMGDEIDKIEDAIDISKKTKRIVYQNIALAISIKIIAIILGLFGFAQMWEAIIADVGVTLVAVLNSLRILK